MRPEGTRFADGGYLANLSQYSAGGYQIGNGSIVATAWDKSSLLDIIGLKPRHLSGSGTQRVPGPIPFSL